MARGDVVNQISASVGTGTLMTYQPSSGVEVMVTATGLSVTDFLQNWFLVGIYNGSTQAWLPFIPPGHATEAGILNIVQMKIFINNTNYFMAKNDTGSTATLWLTAITTKQNIRGWNLTS